MPQQPYYNKLSERADEVGLEVVIENRFGLLFLEIRDRDLGTVAMWPAFRGSIEATARYAWECFDHMQPC